MTSTDIKWSAAALGVLLLASGCNTTEQDFYIGDINDVKLTTDPVITQLGLAADGAPQEIKIISNSKWEILPPEAPFTATATSTEGDGVITVSSAANVHNSAIPTSTLTVRAVDFPEKKITISLMQHKLIFEMNEDKAYPETPEEGGDVEMVFDSSIDWTLEVESGDTGWIDFTPGLSGAGEWDKINVTATWKPNYTQATREMELRLVPTDNRWLEYGVSRQTPFIIKQAAGTLPYDITIGTEETDKTIAPITINYASKAPVDKVELRITNMISNDAYSLDIPQNEGETAYPDHGSIKYTITNLQPGTPYLLIPVITSKVGRAEGEPVRIQTRGDIAINNPEYKQCLITPGVTGVNADIQVTSDFEMTMLKVSLCQTDGTVLATQFGNISTTPDPTGAPIAWTGEVLWDDNVKLAQNTTYYFSIIVTGNDPNTPDKFNTIEVNMGNQHFTTLFRLPEQGDNHPIN